MKLNDLGKLIFLLAVLIVAALLACNRLLEAGDVRSVLFVELGYVTGNGVLAKRKQAPSPVIAPTEPASPATTTQLE